MNDLYIHQLETENKQLREVLKSTNEVAKEYVRIENYCDELESKIDKAIDYITTEQLYTDYQWGKSQYAKILKDLLGILGGKE